MNKETLTLGSLFSGSGGFELAGILSGIKPVWSSEIEPFAVRVTTKRLPEVKHFGDVSRLSGEELPPVDIITFGSPCQDLSVAGRRTGIDGKKSGLFREAVRVITEMREKTNGEKPRYIVWENVPGAFSSNKGSDFKYVLEAVIGIREPGVQVPAPDRNEWPRADVYLGDGWSVAYRTLDAQYWGLPQHRARVFLVADFGGERAGCILFKSEGLSGYSAEGFGAWKRAVRDPEGISGTPGGAFLGKPEGAIALEHHPTDSRIKIARDGVVQTLTERMGTGGNNVPLVMAPCGKQQYLIRKLTPVECARLQGFPDWWCADLGTDDPSEEEIMFWEKVFEEYREASAPLKKPKTRNQIIKWLQDPRRDSSEYRLWGNGVALPCVWFVMAGIVYYDQFQG